MNRDRLLELLDDYLEGELAEERQTELEQLLLQHPEARRLYWDYFQQHMLIQKIEQESDGRVLASAELQPACSQPVLRPRRARWPWLLALAASLLVAVGVGYHVGMRPQNPPTVGEFVVENPPPTRPAPPHHHDDPSPVLLATWLGGTGASSVSAAAVAADGSIYVAGTFPGADVASWQPERVTGRGNGLVLRVATDGRLLAVLRLEGTVDALRLDDAGQVLVAGSFGCARLDGSLRQTTWTAPLKGKNGRIVPGPDGGAVVLTGSTITTLNTQGKQQSNWTIADRDVRDVACDVASKQVFVAGCGTADKVGRVVPFVHAYDLTGKKLWGAYDWTPEEVVTRGFGASSEAICLALGRDGQLYVAGQAHGGNTVWSRSAQDLGQPLLTPRGDRFQSAYNIGNQHLTFIGRLDPRTGHAEAGTVLLGRHTGDKGASMRPSALAVDAEGRVYVGGWAGATPPTSKGAFGLVGQGGGAFLCAFDRDFNRLYAARLCGGKTTALAVGGSAIVAAGDGRDGLTTIRPWQPEPLGDDGWLVVFRKAPGIEYESPIAPLR